MGSGGQVSPLVLLARNRAGQMGISAAIVLLDQSGWACGELYFPIRPVYPPPSLIHPFLR
jgi:hypothetical protein